MGLELVDLFFRVERKFDVRLEDPCSTFGELVLSVLFELRHELPQDDTKPGVEAVTPLFCRKGFKRFEASSMEETREIIIGTFEKMNLSDSPNLSLQQQDATQSLNQLFPRPGRRKRWNQFTQAMLKQDWQMPQESILQIFPIGEKIKIWSARTIIVLVIFLLLFTPFSGFRFWTTWGINPLSTMYFCMCGIVTLLFIYLTVNFLSRLFDWYCFAPRVQTLGQLIEAVWQANFISPPILSDAIRTLDGVGVQSDSEKSELVYEMGLQKKMAAISQIMSQSLNQDETSSKNEDTNTLMELGRVVFDLERSQPSQNGYDQITDYLEYLSPEEKKIVDQLKEMTSAVYGMDVLEIKSDTLLIRR